MSLADKVKQVEVLNAMQEEGWDQEAAFKMMKDKYGISTREDFERLLSQRDVIMKRSAKARERRVDLHSKDLKLIRQLGPVVGSQANRDVTFAGWASTVPSAEAYLKETKKKGWRVQNHDVDGDGFGEVLVFDDDGVVRRINGWGVKESMRPIRDHYYSNHPTKADRRNITMGEWTRGVQVDDQGVIDYMYPDAVRYKKSRQEYYTKNKDKMPIPDAKAVWMQYVAKPLLIKYKEHKPNLFQALDGIPSLASAALSQRFASYGFTWIRCGIYINDEDGDDGDIIKLMSACEFGTVHEMTKQEKSKTMRKLNALYKDLPKLQGLLKDKIVAIADIVTNELDWNNGLITSLVSIIDNIMKVIEQEYEGQEPEYSMTGYERIKHNYQSGRGAEKGWANKEALMKRMRRNEAGMTQNQKDVSEKRRRDYPVQAVTYDNVMGDIDHAQYPFPQALKEWGQNARKLPFGQFMKAMVENIKSLGFLDQ